MISHYPPYVTPQRDEPFEGAKYEKRAHIPTLLVSICSNACGSSVISHHLFNFRLACLRSTRSLQSASATQQKDTLRLTKFKYDFN